MRFVLVLAMLALTLALTLDMPFGARAATRAGAERQFADWIKNQLWPKARAAGISLTTFNRALGGVKPDWSLPGLVMPGTRADAPQTQSQAEFRAPSTYFREQRMRDEAAIGRRLAQTHVGLIARIEAKYRVPGHVLIAIWGRESGFGRAKLPKLAIPVLATRAFLSTRRSLFENELLAALRMIENGQAKPEQLMGSIAGALGQPQFMPSSYLRHAVDFDGDGRADIWGSVPDTLASIANFLHTNGWQYARDWGFEVTIPGNMSCAQEGPDRARKITQWSARGVKRISGRRFPAHERSGEGMMLVPAGRDGPHFIVTSNFYVLKTYNNSDLYALFVGNLGDRIAYDSGGFKRGWGTHRPMLRSGIAAMQRKLETFGFDVGGADGLPGFKTRRSVGEWQAKNRLAQTCFPSPSLIKRLQ